MAMFDKPMGGTELMYEELMHRLPNEIKDKVSIFNYAVNADFSKPTIYWNQLSYDQQAVQFLTERGSVDKIDKFVFVSHWQAEMFRKLFGIPGFKTQVIKNACLGVEQRPIVGKKDKIKLCYTSTPWRGLDVLLDAWEIAKPTDCELHIFSSTKIYGKDFAISTAGNYQELFDRCKTIEGVVYRDFTPNEELRKELHIFDILAYPNTFEETSCITVIEALSAGLRVVTSNLGALPETTEGWARMYPYLMDKQKHAEVFALILVEEIEKVRNGQLDLHLEQQKQIYAPKWSWNKRINEWTNFLNTLPLNEYLTSEPILETSQNSSTTEIQNVGL
jgi:glycosyltransferase involved in cell wall biosynthesis